MESGYVPRKAIELFYVNAKQIVAVPILDSKKLSPAAILIECPFNPEMLGEEIIQMRNSFLADSLLIKEDAKDYWLLPKGIRSWSKFQKSSSLLAVELNDDKFSIFRYYKEKTGSAFFVESETPNLVLSIETSPQALGEAVLEQFQCIRSN